MKTAISYLIEKDWKVSSDPRTYSNYPNNYGYRDYAENGINYDSFCGGYHRAFDLYNNSTSDVPAVTSGTVVTAETHGNFGGTVEVRDSNGNDWIYGHLRRDSIQFSEGDKVTQGDVVGLQGSSNYDDNPMAVHLHIQLRPKGTDLSDEKAEVCTGLPIEKYDISDLNDRADKSKNKGELNESKNGGNVELENIYSSHINGRKMTNAKSSVSGVVIHNDFGNKTPEEYLSWLYARERNGTHVNGFASVYVNRNQILWYHPTNYVEWHCANVWANENLVGLEATESYPGHVTDEVFLENEEATLKTAAVILKSYNLPVNRNTVFLHRQYFATSCPHRSWDIHIGKDFANTKANKNKLADYFIERIKFYYDGGELPASDDKDATTIETEDIEKEIAKHVEDQKVETTEWEQNDYYSWYKEERGTFTNGSEPIQAWYVGPFLISGNEAGKLPPSATINYDEVIKQSGYVWVAYDSFEGDRIFLPVRTWNEYTNTVGEEWGTIT